MEITNELTNYLAENSKIIFYHNKKAILLKSPAKFVSDYIQSRTNRPQVVSVQIKSKNIIELIDDSDRVNINQSVRFTNMENQSESKKGIIVFLQQR